MTEDKATLVPQIRFRGFTDAWVQRKLGDIAEFSKGNGYSKGDLIDKGNPIILYGRLYTNYETLIENVDTFTKMKENSVLSQGGEVIIPSSGETAEDISRASVVAKAGIILGGDLNIVKPDSTIYPTFLAIIISNGNQQKELSKRAQGKSVVHISNSDLKEVVLQLPSITEQIAINNFFRTLDDTITLYKRKLDGLKELKKGYLQQMFPQAGENEPRVRFAGFTKPWEQRKLGENAKVTMGQSPDSINYTNNPNDHILVQGNADMKNGKVVPRVYTTQITKTAQKGEIILSIRAPVGDVGKTDYNIVLGRGVAAINGNEFIYQTLIRIKEFGYWKKIIQGSTFESINSNDLREIVVFVPYPSEQITIGKFFRNFDEQITMHQAKLDKLKKLKESYLQKMFI